MTPTSNMVVPLRDLPVARHIELSNAFVRSAIADLPTRQVLERPDDDPDAGGATAQVELHSDEDDHVFARGTLSGWFHVACSRCVDPVRFSFDESLTVTFLPDHKLPPDALDAALGKDDAEIELAEDDLNLYGYQGENIDLEPLLREQLILAAPFAPLCREDCQGLCPQCGAERNREACSCEPPIDPRLAALKDLKL